MDELKRSDSVITDAQRMNSQMFKLTANSKRFTSKKNAPRKDVYTFSDESMFRLLTSKKIKPYNIEDYGVYSNLKDYRKHLETQRSAHVACHVLDCGSHMRSIEHFLAHSMTCHSEDILIQVEVESEIPLPPQTMISRLVPNSPPNIKIRVKRTFNFSEIETLRKEILTRIY